MLDNQAVPEIDLSAGLQPKPISATGQVVNPNQQIDLSAGFQPKPVSSLTDAVVGNNTAAGVPLSETQNQEASGVGDIFQGNFKQGLGKIYNSEIGSMHIISGSPIEKVIQTFNPEFKGGVTPSQAEQENHANRAGLENPAIDLAQYVDKDKHPVWKAVTEAAQSLTSPENVAIMISTGGLGLVESPKALGMANKLLSAGFSAQAIGQAYTHFKDFKEAYDNGNANEALYQITHSVLSGAMAITAGAHATGNELPLARPGLQENAVGAVTDALGKAGEAAKNVAGGIGSKIVDTAKKALDLDKTFTDVLRKASPPTKGNALEYDSTLKDAEPQLREVFRRNPDVSTPEEMYKALDQHIKGQEGLLQAKAEQYHGKPESAMPNIHSDVLNAVDKAFDEAGGQYTAPEKRAALDAIDSHMAQEAGKSPEGKQLYRNPDLFEAEGIRQRFNEDSNPVFGSNAPSVPKAEAFAKAAAAQELRNQIDAKYDELGVGNVKEWRKQEAALIDVRDQIGKAQNKAIEMGQWDGWKALVQRQGWKAALGLIAGAGTGPEGSLVTGAGAGLLGLLHDYLRDVKTNPNRLIQRAADMANKQGASGAKLPTKLTTPYTTDGVQDAPLDMPENRLPNGVTSSAARGHEWGHAIVAHKEGFPVTEIQSHLHPELKGTPNLAGAVTDLSPLGVDKAGLIPIENLHSNLDKVLSIVMGGAAANDIHDSISLEDNRGARGDVGWAKRVLKEAGFNPVQTKQMIQSAFDRAKNHLTDPDASDILKENRDAREPGLSKSLHVSGDRLKEVFDELDRRQAERKNEGNNRGLEENNGEHGQVASSGREGEAKTDVEQKATTGEKVTKYQVYDPKTGNVIGEYSTSKKARNVVDKKDSEYGAVRYGVRPIIKSNLTGELKESSTGDSKVDEVIRTAGGIPAGSMENLALFHDPKTGSTLALNKSEVSSDTVLKHIAESRKKFDVK